MKSSFLIIVAMIVIATGYVAAHVVFSLKDGLVAVLGGN